MSTQDPRKTRLDLLRQMMKSQNWQACIFTGTDPHESEYPAEHWQNREFLTGFTGSAGIIAVTDRYAGLWTDSRYYLQAKEELKGSSFDLFHEGEINTPSLPQWLSQILDADSVLALEACTCSVTRFRRLCSQTPASFVWKPVQDPLKDLWIDRPSKPCSRVWEYQETLLEKGEALGITPRVEKMRFLVQLTKSQGAKSLLLTALDEIAWTLNLRGADTSYNPVFLSWLYLTEGKVLLFINPHQIEASLVKRLKDDGLELKPYDELESFLQTLRKDESLLVSLDSLHIGLFSVLKQSNVCLYEASASPCSLLKSHKTDRELQLIRRATEKDGLALIEFMSWFDRHQALSNERDDWTETGLAAKLEGFRQKQEGYQGPSFSPIFAFRDKAAIIHYRPAGEGQRVRGQGLLLLDTGAQYLEGTTDITRVLALGNPTQEQKWDYTLVLKAYIQVVLTSFPVGTKGYSIDAIARSALWKKGIDYGHGTGHGVGHFLCVHEGPVRLNSDPLPTALEEGMVMSNEPGLYREGAWGIRLENLQLVTKDQQTPFGNFLKWEVLSLCPFSYELIQKNLLDNEELTWLNSYHKMVKTRLWSRLSPEAQKWLEKQTLPF